MASRAIIRAGYDFTRKYNFLLDGAAEDLSSATIKALVKNYLKTATLVASVAQTNSGGANWGQGSVVLAFAAASTVGIAAQEAWIEVQVTLAGLKLPYEDIAVTVEAGYQ